MANFGLDRSWLLELSSATKVPPHVLASLGASKPLALAALAAKHGVTPPSEANPTPGATLAHKVSYGSGGVSFDAAPSAPSDNGMFLRDIWQWLGAGNDKERPTGPGDHWQGTPSSIDKGDRVSPPLPPGSGGAPMTPVSGHPGESALVPPDVVPAAQDAQRDSMNALSAAQASGAIPPVVPASDDNPKKSVGDALIAASEISGVKAPPNPTPAPAGPPPRTNQLPMANMDALIGSLGIGSRHGMSLKSAV